MIFKLYLWLMFLISCPSWKTLLRFDWSYALHITYSGFVKRLCRGFLLNNIMIDYLIGVKGVLFTDYVEWRDFLITWIFFSRVRCLWFCRCLYGVSLGEIYWCYSWLSSFWVIGIPFSTKRFLFSSKAKLAVCLCLGIKYEHTAHINVLDAPVFIALLCS